MRKKAYGIVIAMAVIAALGGCSKVQDNHTKRTESVEESETVTNKAVSSLDTVETETEELEIEKPKTEEIQDGTENETESVQTETADSVTSETSSYEITEDTNEVATEQTTEQSTEQTPTAEISVLVKKDEEAAVNVRRIFVLRKSGKSNGEIARIFNEEGIPVPSVYMKEKFNAGVFSSKSDHPMWTSSQISTILRNETYAGTFVYDKYRTEVIGSRKTRLLPKSEWKRIPDHHEKIVSMEDFLAVQNEDATFFGSGVSYSGKKRLFTGIIICSQCGCNLQYAYSAKGRDTYRCKGKYTGGVNHCKSHVFSDEVELAVKEQLSLYLSTLSDTNRLLEERNAKQEEKRKAAREHLDKMNDAKRKLEVDLRDAYENYAKRITDKETYLSQREVYDTMLANLEEKREQQEVAVNNIEAEIAETSTVGGITISEDGIDLKELTREVVETFIDKIVVYEDKRIEIRWKFQNPFE